MAKKGLCPDGNPPKTVTDKNGRVSYVCGGTGKFVMALQDNLGDEESRKRVSTLYQIASDMYDSIPEERKSEIEKTIQGDRDLAISRLMSKLAFGADNSLSPARMGEDRAYNPDDLISRYDQLKNRKVAIGQNPPESPTMLYDDIYSGVFGSFMPTNPRDPKTIKDPSYLERLTGTRVEKLQGNNVAATPIYPALKSGAEAIPFIAEEQIVSGPLEYGSGDTYEIFTPNNFSLSGYEKATGHNIRPSAVPKFTSAPAPVFQQSPQPVVETPAPEPKKSFFQNILTGLPLKQQTEIQSTDMPEQRQADKSILGMLKDSVMGTIKKFTAPLIGGQESQQGGLGLNLGMSQPEATGLIPGAGVVDVARSQPGMEYRRMFNPAPVSPMPPEVVPVAPEVITGEQSELTAPPVLYQGSPSYSGGGGAMIITDPRMSGRYTAQGKDLGYNPIAFQEPDNSRVQANKDLYSQLFAMYSRPIDNADFYPQSNNINKGNVSVGDMSASVYAGSLGLPPAAAIDKMNMRKTLRSAMDQLMTERKEEADLGFVPPEIRQAAIMPQIGSMFEMESNALVSDLQQKYGANWRRMAKSDEETWRFANKWKSIQTAMNEGYEAAQEYLKLYAENQKSGNKAYFPEDAVKTAKWLVTGVNEMSKGLPVDVEELGKMMSRFEVLSNYDTWANDVLKNKDIRTSFVSAIPEAVEAKLVKDPSGQTDPDFIKNGKQYKDFPDGYRAYLIQKKVNEVSQETAKAQIESWDKANPGSWKQLRNYDAEPKEKVLNRAIQDFQKMLGTEIDNEIRSVQPRKGTSITVGGQGGGAQTTGSGIYQNTVSAVPDIIQYIRSNSGKMDVDQLLREAGKYGEAKGSWQPEDYYLGLQISGLWDLANKATAPGNFSEYVIPQAPFRSRMKSLTAKDAMGSSFSGEIPENLAPTSSRIKNVSLVFGVPDKESAGGYRIITKEDLKSRGVPDNAQPLFMQKEELVFDKDEYQKSDPRLANLPGFKPKKTGSNRVTFTGYKIYPASQAVGKNYDAVVSDKEINASPGGMGLPGGSTVTVAEGTDFSDLE